MIFFLQVSTEAPRFRTVATNRVMRVVHPPSSGPYLSGGNKKGYRWAGVSNKNVGCLLTLKKYIQFVLKLTNTG